jgi:hypothetical protein
MAKIITILPCEKVIVGRDNLPSLIALFEHINIALSEGQDVVEVPKDTITYQRWAVFSEWEIDEKEVELKKAEQVLELEYPDGSSAPVRGRIQFEWQVAGIVRNHQEIYGFPIGQEGWYTIRLWLERDGKRISNVGERKVRIIHKLDPSHPQKPIPVLGVSPISDQK